MARHNYPYKKSVTVTVWVIQFIVCLILLAASSWIIWLIASNNRPKNFREWRGFFTAAAGLQIGIVSVNIIMNIVEIVLIAKKRMPPALFLTNACLKSAIWGILFILNVLSVSLIAIVLTLILFLTSMVQLVHAAIIVHRKRHGFYEGGEYSRASNPVDLMSGMAVGVETQSGYLNENVNTEYKTPLVEPPEYGNTTMAYSPRQPSPLYELDNRDRN
ncbi:uncharacterized protein GGS22DRAFT_170247 [Annulohypoxylon maeteangense]|uniref:uncharacterized protein n=1 Tax=Annulohypoxylon maeteangense TaxID=1927788 RepID=UPI0020075754|nr:uncharacterized protein GGS22DRAFT_170247 [Annulohypoxylon maeteangense]KAI0882111.1 hypothetical protein GGS22DRAFT_170247 [Annulohypoxylon maeteangense]